MSWFNATYKYFHTVNCFKISPNTMNLLSYSFLILVYEIINLLGRADMLSGQSKIASFGKKKKKVGYTC